MDSISSGTKILNPNTNLVEKPQCQSLLDASVKTLKCGLSPPEKIGAWEAVWQNKNPILFLYILENVTRKMSISNLKINEVEIPHKKDYPA